MKDKLIPIQDAISDDSVRGRRSGHSPPLWPPADHVDFNLTISSDTISSSLLVDITDRLPNSMNYRFRPPTRPAGHRYPANRRIHLDSQYICSALSTGDESNFLVLGEDMAAL